LWIPRAAALALLLLLGGCALRPAAPDAFTFAVMGDVPYGEEEELRFRGMVEALGAEPFAFVAHVGDFRGGDETCSDALFRKRQAQFDASAHPFVFTPGDNEWSDCPGLRGAPSLERLARLREIFFATDTTLGLRRLPQRAQRACLSPAVDGCGCGALPENRAWRVQRVAFVTVNLSGGRNNVGRGAATDAEAHCRDVGNARWLAQAAREAHESRAVGLVILTQANPWWTNGPEFDAFLDAVRQAAATYRGPVLLVHGDTHFYRADQPFRDALGEPVPNLQRLETWGSPFVGWVEVHVDPARPEPFTFTPRVHAATVPWWLLRAYLPLLVR
jgi:hypothetical protein